MNKSKQARDQEFLFPPTCFAAVQQSAYCEWQDGRLLLPACFTKIVLTDSQMCSLFLSHSVHRRYSLKLTEMAAAKTFFVAGHFLS